jgi:phosphatidylethanolamine/phosphatidyl-N-methylethanolamine N-methyltransferase
LRGKARIENAVDSATIEGPMSRVTGAEHVADASRRVERVYGVLARVYDGFFDWPLVPGRRHALARLMPRAGERVLEIGVGTGLSLPSYPPGCQVVGIDISEPMLERARARLRALGRANVLLEKMDARAIAYDDGHFDKVLAPYVISVVPDPARVMSEIARVCRPGGSVIVVNHFQSAFPPLAAVEHLLTPLSTWIGFRLDLPVAATVRTPGLTLLRQQRVNLLGLWQMLEFRRD